VLRSYRELRHTAPAEIATTLARIRIQRPRLGIAANELLDHPFSERDDDDAAADASVVTDNPTVDSATHALPSPPSTMSRLFPHTAYAEDQPLSHLILTTHVLTRGLTAGTMLGTLVATARHSIPALRPRAASAAALARPLPAKVLLGASAGSVAGVGLLAVALAARMRGREDVEWRDRAWRLLENEGQLETDDWTYAGMGLAAGTALATGKVRAMGWRALVGAMGLGSVGGMVGYMAWRYGLNGGRFPDRRKKTERPGGL